MAFIPAGCMCVFDWFTLLRSAGSVLGAVAVWGFSILSLTRGVVAFPRRMPSARHLQRAVDSFKSNGKGKKQKKKKTLLFKFCGLFQLC